MLAIESSHFPVRVASLGRSGEEETHVRELAKIDENPFVPRMFGVPEFAAGDGHILSSESDGCDVDADVSIAIFESRF